MRCVLVRDGGVLHLEAQGERDHITLGNLVNDYDVAGFGCDADTGKVFHAQVRITRTQEPGRSVPDLAACQSPLVRAILDAGGSLEDVIAALDSRLASAIDRVLQLEAMAPKRYRLPNGSVAVFQCPEDLIPIEDLSAIFKPGERP